jgi:hypothetical protein
LANRTVNPEAAQQFYENITPLKILQELHNANSKSFIYNPRIHGSHGHVYDYYLIHLLKYLNVDKTLHFDGIELPDGSIKLYYSLSYQDQVERMEGKFVSLSYMPKIVRPPTKDIEIITIKLRTDVVHDPATYLPGNLFATIPSISRLQSMVINNDRFAMESVLLSNYNECPLGFHAIAGITCGKDRYVYNGWINPEKKGPCNLVPFDWLRDDTTFCLNPRLCKLDQKNLNDLCFSFMKGRRVYILVNEKYKRNSTIVKPIKPPNVKPIKPVNINPIKPINVKPIKPINVKPIKPINVKPIKPINVKPYKPANINPIKPVNVKPIKPINVKPIKPVNVKPIKPVNVKPIKPANVRPIKPANVRPIKPANVRPKKASCSKLRKAECIESDTCEWIVGKGCSRI